MLACACCCRSGQALKALCAATASAAFQLVSGLLETLQQCLSKQCKATAACSLTCRHKSSSHRHSAEGFLLWCRATVLSCCEGAARAWNRTGKVACWKVRTPHACLSVCRVCQCSKVYLKCTVCSASAARSQWYRVKPSNHKSRLRGAAVCALQVQNISEWHDITDMAPATFLQCVFSVSHGA